MISSSCALEKVGVPSSLLKSTSHAFTSVAGDIHIWDRESGSLLHHVRAQVLGGDLTCIAWNHAHDTFMFATGSHDGAVRIWTTPMLEEVSSGFLGIEDYGSSRATTNPVPTPRTNTPSPYEMERAESPATQLTFQIPESLDGHSGSTPPDSQDSSQPSTDSGPVMYRGGDRRAVTFT